MSGSGARRTSSYASRRAHCSMLSPLSLRPRGRNHWRVCVSCTTTTLDVVGWMMTMDAASWNSRANQMLFGTAAEEQSDSGGGGGGGGDVDEDVVWVRCICW